MQEIQNIIEKIERMVLSAILFSPDKFDEICEVLTYTDFLFPLHSCMFHACEILYKTNMPITSEIVCIEMNKTMQVSLDDIAHISAEFPTANLDTYVEQIKNASINRSLLSLASFIRDESIKSGSIAKDTLEKVEKRLYALSLQDSHTDFRNAEDVILSTIELIKANKAKMGALKGINTGFRDLNIATTGFNPGELIVIGARPSMGKTALILSMALKIISSHKGVAIFSLEMPAEQLMLRMLSAKSMVPLQSVRSGDMNDSEFTKLTQATQDLSSHRNLYIDDGSQLTLAGLRTKMRKLKARDNTVSIAMIDYLQLMSGMESMNAKAVRHEFIAEISRGLKNLARELNIPIIALSQLNRMLENRDDKRPILSDLRESGAIEQDADIIIFLYRDEVYKERESKQQIAAAKRKKNQGEEIDIQDPYKAPDIELSELILAKNRNGETRTIEMLYNKKYTLFQDINEEKETQMAIANATTYMLNNDMLDENSNIDFSGMPNM